MKKNIDFDLRGDEYIELNKLLKLLGLVDTGGESNARITNGEVLVNSAVEIQKRKKIRTGDKVEFEGTVILVQ